MADRYDGSYEDDLTQKHPIEEHLQMMMTFAQEHETTLKSLLMQTRNKICETSDNPYRLIRVAVENVERIYPQDFLACNDLTTDEQQQYANINKIMIAFIYLQDEISELKHIAEMKFYYPIVMFGQQPIYQIHHTDDSNNSNYLHELIKKFSSHVKPGEKEVTMGLFLPFLQELSNFIERCYHVCCNLIQQMNVFMNLRELIYKRLFQYSHMHSIFQSLSDLLVIMVTLDLAVQQNDSLLDFWSCYKSMITLIRQNMHLYDTNDGEILRLERIVVSIDQTIMIGEIFKNCVEQNFDDVFASSSSYNHGSNPAIVKIDSVRHNTLLQQDILSFVKLTLDNHVNIFSNNSSATSTGTEKQDKEGILVAMAMYVLYRQILPSNQPPDLKFHKVLWNIQKIVPFIIMHDKIIFTIPEFLQTFLPSWDMKKLEISNPLVFRRQWMTTFDQQLSAKTAQLAAQCNAWYVICESKIPVSLRYEVEHMLGTFEIIGSILLKGLSLASKITSLLNTMLMMHYSMQIPLTKSHVHDIAMLIEHAKAIEYTFVRKDFIFIELLPHMLHHLAEEIVKFLKPIKIKLESLKMSSSPQSMVGSIDQYVRVCYVLYIITLLENLLKSTDNYSSCRNIILNFFVELISASTLLGADKEVMKLKLLTKRILLLSNLMSNVREACSTQFLYFHIDLLSPMIQEIYSTTTEGNRLQYLVAGFADGIKLISFCRHKLFSVSNQKLQNQIEENMKNFFASYRFSIKQMITKDLILPLCHHIESDLRLHVHMKHLPHMQTYNPKFTNNQDEHAAAPAASANNTLVPSMSSVGNTVTGSIGITVLRSYATFLSIPSLHILGHVMNVLDEITHHLNKTFYNLTTITLHDWKMYAEMKSLAYEKYNLKLMNNFLPMGSLDQGLDVLQIMRNIHIFVNRFNYNMNIQQFVEYRSAGSALNTNTASSKHINTIKIQSIAASIRQHGLGVLNTTVNYTYQFLTQKFHIFREFLHDDHIRAHLSREHRWYRKHRHDQDVNNVYPYEHGLKFVKDIKKLGLNEGGKSYLDLFRATITEIGNALGYVRMVRSASMYYCSEAVKYLPDLENIISFEENAGKGSEGSIGANFHEECVRAGKNLDEVIKNLIKNFDAGSDYFKVLVNVFQTVLLREENEDLKNFFMIVPALCISWIDASLQAKDNMFKATRGIYKEMYFTDDGFAMGIAYCLAITKQTRKFEALHWVDSMRGKIRADANQLEQQQAARAQKEAKIKEAKEKTKKSFSFFGKKQEKPEEKGVDEDYEDLEEIHSLQNTAKRLEANRRETEQLFYSLSGAAIFFRRTDVDT